MYFMINICQFADHQIEYDIDVRASDAIGPPMPSHVEISPDEDTTLGRVRRQLPNAVGAFSS